MSGNGGGGGGAARPPPSASMGKLSLEDDKARKSNANGPPGKNLRNVPEASRGCKTDSRVKC